MVLISAWLAGRLMNRAGYPSVLGELLVGIVLGPPLLGLLHGSEVLAVLAEVGVLLMMLYIGMEVDPRELRRAAWPGLPAAAAAFMAPFVLAFLAVTGFGWPPMAGIFLGIAAGMTSLATGARILAEMKVLDTRIACVMMTSALVADTLALLIFAGVVSVAERGGVDLLVLLRIALGVGAFFALVFLVGTQVLPRLWDRLSRAGLTERTSHFMLVLIIAVLFGELAEIAGLHAILGAFVAGMFLRENVLGRKLSHELMGVVRESSLGFLAPIFFVTAGFQVSFVGFGENLGLFAVLLGIAFFGKIAAVTVSYAATGHSWREGVVAGAGMNGRGAVEIIIAGLGLEMGLLDQRLFSVLVVTSLCTTALTPLALKAGVAWLKGRDELIRSADAREGTLIIGAGATARALARALVGPVGASQLVWLVDSSPERCARARKDGLTAICGNALQEAVLSRAQAGRASSVIAMTANSEVNVLAAKLAREVFGAPEVMVINAGRSGGKGLNTALRHLCARQLFNRPVAIKQWDQWIGDEEVSRSVAPLPGITELPESSDERTDDDPSLILAVRRGSGIRPYDGETELAESDEVIMLTRKAPVS